MDSDSESSGDESDEERMLSAQHGEAGEGRSEKRGAPASGDDGADESLKAEVTMSATGKKKRPKFEVKSLIGPDGLIAIRNSFPDIVGPSFKGAGSEAAYASKLVRAYDHWCNKLFNGLHPQDLLLKVEKCGTTREVQSYVNEMREEERRRYLTKTFGEEGAQSLLFALGEGNRNDSGGLGYMEEESRAKTAAKALAISLENEAAMGSSMLSESRKAQMKALLEDDQDQESEATDAGASITPGSVRKSSRNEAPEKVDHEFTGEDGSDAEADFGDVQGREKEEEEVEPEKEVPMTDADPETEEDPAMADAPETQQADSQATEDSGLARSETVESVATQQQPETQQFSG
jgi:hypothetical protein